MLDLIPQNLLFGVVVEMAVALETTLHYLPELLRKHVVIEQMVDTESRARGFSRIRWTYPFLRCPNTERQM